MGQAAPPEPAEVEVQEPSVEPGATWPLTGIAVSQEGNAQTEGRGDPLAGEFGPVLSVKIENSPASRPQGGLEHADVVWEELVEGGMTRFVAMFHSRLPETLGPIRSIRPMDAAIAGPAGGVLAFSGGQAEYQARIRQTGITMVSHDGGSPGFFRNPSRTGDHRLFGFAQQLLAAGAGQAGPRALFAFAEDGEEPTAARDGQAAARVVAHFPSSRPAWEWNGQAWQRLESGRPARAESGARLEAANVVVAPVEIRDTGNRDGAGAMVPETVLTGQADALVFSGGRVIEGTWQKGADTDLMVLHDAGGSEVRLAPGTTWVELVPVSGGGVEVS